MILLAWPPRGDYQEGGNCDMCLAKRKKLNTHQGQHRPASGHGYPGQTLFMDLVGPLSTAPNNYKYVLTMQDAFSRYALGTPILCKEAETVAHALMEKWILHFGCPSHIHSDQGTEFKNTVWSALCDRLEIKKTTMPSYNRHSNPVERFHRTLGQILHCFMPRDEKNWTKYISIAAFAYNTKINKTTNLTPFETFIG